MAFRRSTSLPWRLVGAQDFSKHLPFLHRAVDQIYVLSSAFT